MNIKLKSQTPKGVVTNVEKEDGVLFMADIVLAESDISWDEWYEDLVRPDGSIMAKDALWIRGTLDTEHGLIEYQIPIWPEALADDPDTMKQFAKESLVMTIQGHMRRFDVSTR